MPKGGSFLWKQNGLHPVVTDVPDGYRFCCRYLCMKVSSGVSLTLRLSLFSVSLNFEDRQHFMPGHIRLPGILYAFRNSAVRLGVKSRFCIMDVGTSDTILVSL